MDDSNFRETDSIPSEDVAIRLPIEFDPAKLIRDLEAVKHVDLAPQPGPYHDGAWKGISLHSQGGKQSAHPGYAGLDGFYPTDALKHTPYMKEILDGLQCPKKVVRLLTLPPGVEIGEHNDAWANFYCGTLRLHIPIITHPDVEFVINDRRCIWKPGEFWYGDFSLPHWVKNGSSIIRIHMVIDVEITDWVLTLFPKEFIERVASHGDGIAKHRDPIPTTAAELAPFVCDFRMPPEVMPLFGGGKKMAEMAAGARGQVRVDGGRLLVVLNDQPACALERIGNATFNVVGLGAGCAVEFELGDGRATGMSLVLRGLPDDLYAAQLGYQQGPMIYTRRVAFPLT